MKNYIFFLVLVAQAVNLSSAACGGFEQDPTSRMGGSYRQTKSAGNTPCNSPLKPQRGAGAAAAADPSALMDSSSTESLNGSQAAVDSPRSRLLTRELGVLSLKQQIDCGSVPQPFAQEDGRVVGSSFAERPETGTPRPQLNARRRRLAVAAPQQPQQAFFWFPPAPTTNSEEQQSQQLSKRPRKGEPQIFFPDAEADAGVSLALAAAALVASSADLRATRDPKEDRDGRDDEQPESRRRRVGQAQQLRPSAEAMREFARRLF